MKSKYSYPQKLLTVNGKKIKRLPRESRCQYLERVRAMPGGEKNWE